jgi:4-amino-4-deoxy-L-arabinose transferase-like glycosyltransferase
VLYVQNPDPVTGAPRQAGIARHDARLLALVLLAIGLRLLYIGTQPDTSHLGSTDAWGYHRLALNLDLGHGFSLDRQAPYRPDSVRTPLYPLFLLLVRRALAPQPRIAALVQALLEGVSTLLTYRLTAVLAARLDAPSGRRLGRIAALLYALNPVQVRQTNELLTETLLSLLLLLCLCILARYLRPHSEEHSARLALALGVTTALAALCKPNVQYLPLLWMPTLLLARQRYRFRNAALAALAFIAVLSPWVTRNVLVYHRVFLSTAFQGNVSRISAPATTLTARGRRTGSPSSVIPWSAEWESAFGEIVAEAAERYRWDQAWETMDPRARSRADRQVYRVAREILFRHPWAWVASHLQGTLRYLEPQVYRALYHHWTGATWPPDVLDDALIHASRAALRGDGPQAQQIIAQERWNKLTPLQRAIWWGMLTAILLTLILVACGAWRLRRHPALLWATLGTIGYVLLLPGPIAYERFRVPVLGPILALAALAFASPWGLCYNRRR